MGARVWVDDGALTKYFLGVYKRDKNYRPVFRWARKELANANRRNFRHQGAPTGHPWPDLDESYARWKLAEYGPQPILVATGALHRSLTFLRGHPNNISRHHATFGTDIPYAKWHQRGTRKMPMRKIIFTPQGFARGVAEKAGQWLVHGKGATSVWRRMKGLFQA